MNTIKFENDKVIMPDGDEYDIDMPIHVFIGACQNITMGDDFELKIVSSIEKEKDIEFKKEMIKINENFLKSGTTDKYVRLMVTNQNNRLKKEIENYENNV